jgi:TetR/AcrR family transcriptional regulator, acrAB operon repressor
MITEKKKTKRENIAKSCLELFSINGFHNVTVSEIAKTAGIGKGTVYEYFSNKEDIVLELMECLQSDYDKKLVEFTNDNIDTKQFIYTIFDIFIDEQNIHGDKIQ